MIPGDDPVIGRTLLGRYRVVLPLAQGGMGSVHLARTEGAAGFAKPVVVKRLLPELVTSRRTVELFVQEARILADLQYPGIVNVLDFGEEDSAYVMVLEYVHGYDLRAWSAYATAAGLAVTAECCFFVVLKVLQTLEYAHHHRRPDGRPLGIVHRDVSPGNVLLALDGQVKLSDFGIARINEEASESNTQFGVFRGKFAYAAPELLEGALATQAADIYSAGVVLAELLLGYNPYSAATVAESVQRVLTQPPPALEELRPELPAGLDAVLSRAMARNPQDRFATAGAMAEAVNQLLGTPEQVVAGLLAERLRADFGGDMPTMLGLMSLDERECAWRGAPSAERPDFSGPPLPARPRPALYSTSDATVPRGSVPPSADTPRPASRARRLWAWPLGAAMLAALVSGVWLVARARASNETEVLIIERRYTEPQLQESDPVPSASGNPLRPRDSALVPSALRLADHGKESVRQDLSEPVQRERTRLRACFENHWVGSGAPPQTRLRFELGAEGSVKRVSVESKPVASLPLRQCLLSVAESIRFAAPGEPVSFRIPITAVWPKPARP
ncbi:protein kinase [Myxococcota bacterium]